MAPGGRNALMLARSTASKGIHLSGHSALAVYSVMQQRKETFRQNKSRQVIDDLAALFMPLRFNRHQRGFMTYELTLRWYCIEPFPNPGHQQVPPEMQRDSLDE